MGEDRRVAARRNSRRGGAIAAWVAPLWLAGAVAVVLPCTARAEPEIFARVNGEPVSRAELRRMRGNPLTLRQARQELGVENPDPEALDRLAMRRVIQHRLMVQEAVRRNLVVSESELDEAIAALRRRFDDLRDFGAWMKEQGLDDRSLFDAIRSDMLAERALAALVDGVRVTDEEVRRYYDAHEGELRREEVRLRIIAVKDRATADEVMVALRNGDDFAGLARRRSVGLRAAKGGDMGWVGSESLPSPLREAVAMLRAGEARGPLQRGQEFLVVLLQGRRSGAKRSLAAVRPEIERGLLPARRRESVEAWLAERERKSTIEVFAAVQAPAGAERAERGR